MTTIKDYIKSLTKDKEQLTNSLKEGGVQVEATETFTSLVPKIASIKAPVIESKDIDFIDYDGTIVASWTLSELANKTELPTNPSHEGLVAQGWNWTLEDLKLQNTKMVVGQSYTTDDGATRLHMDIYDAINIPVELNFDQSIDSGITIDWGDGSLPETVSGTTGLNASHLYAKVGKYTISMLPQSECTLTLGRNTTIRLFGSNNSANFLAKNGRLIGINIGEKVILKSHCLVDCYSLRTITLPLNITIPQDSIWTGNPSLISLTLPISYNKNCYYICHNNSSLSSVSLPKNISNIDQCAFIGCSLEKLTLPTSVMTKMGVYAVQNNDRLKYINIPEGITTIDQYAFSGCILLMSIKLPSTLTKIGSYCFNNCRGLSVLTIPASVTTIDNYAFSSCTNMQKYYFQAITPPTLAGTGVFSGIPSNCIIYVPDESLEAYKAATNWSNFASQIKPMSEESLEEEV